MAFKDELESEVKKYFREAWEVRDGVVVPDPEDISLGNKAVHFAQATVLYADLDGSTSLVDGYKWEFAAEVYKSYLYCAARIIRNEGGEIVSYDGDRVMALFIGDSQSTSAVRAGLKINWAVKNIINPAIKAQYTASKFEVKQVVGIDRSTIRAARTGIRGGNDIVWVGRAANHAAKMTELTQKPTWISSEVYNEIHESAKFSNGVDMWVKHSWNTFDNRAIYGSTYWWSIS